MSDHDKEFLELERLKIKSRLAGLLPYDIARRYHALPISKDGEKITVVMADPNDSEARKAVLKTLGPSTYFVKADIHAIDNSLDVLWPEPSIHSPPILIWTPTSYKVGEVNVYAQQIATLLNSRTRQSECQGVSKNVYVDLSLEVEHLNANLVILGIPERSTLKRLLHQQPEISLLDRMPISLLVTRSPRWPLKKLLLVIRNEKMDDLAIDWAVLLARRSGAAITILPILPPVPLMYTGLNQMRYNLPTLLTTNCPLGRRMRQIVQRLNEWEIKGTLRLRDETPDMQIRAEVVEGDYDLIIIAYEPRKRLLNYVLGEFVTSLIDWAEQPVLVAKLQPV